MKKVIIEILTTILICASLVIVLDLSVVTSTRESIYDDRTQMEQMWQTEESGASGPGWVDCILILGCGVRVDGTPSPMLEDRLETGIDLYNNGAAAKILISGDNGQITYNEIHVMLHYLLDRGIPPEDIFCDHAGFSTYDSVHRANSIFGAQRMIIVTQKYHQYRAQFIASKLGIESIGVCAPNIHYRGWIYREIREIAARDKDFVKSILRPAPTYGGDSIPLSGDSLLSWEESELK